MAVKKLIEAMNIYSPKGTKVIFAFPDAGYEHQIKIAQKHLTLNKVYTVDHIEIHKWHSNVYLKEKPGIGFNSCLFKEKK